MVGSHETVLESSKQVLKPLLILQSVLLELCYLYETVDNQQTYHII